MRSWIWSLALAAALLAPVATAQQRALVPDNDPDSHERPAPHAEYHSVPMLAAGVVLLDFGVAGIVLGASFIGASKTQANDRYESCSGFRFCRVESEPVVDEDMRTAGLIAMVSGLAVSAASVPLIVFGARKETTEARLLLTPQGPTLAGAF